MPGRARLAAASAGGCGSGHRGRPLCALRGAGSCTGVVTAFLPILRAAAATAGPHWQPYRERLVSRRVALFDRPGGEKCRPCARSQASRGRRDASDECARGDPTLVPDVEATVSSDNENKDMLGSEQGGGWSAGPACVSSTRRAAANYLRGADGQVINCARAEEALRRKV